MDQQVDRRDLRDDGKSGEQVGLSLLHDGLVLALGDGQMRGNVIELPTERRVFRPSLRDRLSSCCRSEPEGGVAAGQA